jgi:hypothetical protein
MNLVTFLGSLHLCGMIIENVYGFLIEDKILDNLYLISFLLLPLSWIICKDECIISYLLKKYQNPYYQLGDEPENTKDISDLFPSSNYYLFFYHSNHLLRIVSVIIVNHRNTSSSSQISYFLFYPTLIMYSIYIYDITFRLCYRKRLYPYFQILFSAFLFTILYDKLFHFS